LIARAVPLLLLLVAPGCRQLLDIPSDVSELDGGGGADDDGADDDGADDDDGGDGSDDGGGSAADAGSGADSGSGRDGGPSCIGTTTTSIGFEDPSELDSWLVDLRFGCELVVENSRMVVRQIDPPGFCRAFRELEMDMLDYGLQVQIADGSSDQMSMVYSIILDDGNPDITDRRRLRIERDDGLIKLGECVGDVCDTEIYGSFPYDPKGHEWWRFGHDAETETMHFEFASSDEIFTRPTEAVPVGGITEDLVRCVGAELGTYEATLTDSGAGSFDFLVAGGGS